MPSHTYTLVIVQYSILIVVIIIIIIIDIWIYLNIFVLKTRKNLPVECTLSVNIVSMVTVLLLFVLKQMERIDYSNVLKMADLLQKKTAYTSAYVHLISLLYHCLLIPG